MVDKVDVLLLELLKFKRQQNKKWAKFQKQLDDINDRLRQCSRVDAIGGEHDFKERKLYYSSGHNTGDEKVVI
ncbi:MAG: hypothetical protein DRJ50_12425 [Actinobacteria bacterium]|nr:MAG: hypothetical protein DRJ50_12425 [Actinomycetota bacterium]